MATQTAEENFISLTEASELTQRSIQTIRRAIKLKKVDSRRHETPQGFTYFVNKKSLATFYGITDGAMPRKQAGLKSPRGKKSDTVSGTEIRQLYKTIQDLVQQHAKERENFLKIIQGFQDRIGILEKQLKLIQAPKEEVKKKSWWKFW